MNYVGPIGHITKAKILDMDSTLDIICAVNSSTTRMQCLDFLVLGVGGNSSSGRRSLGTREMDCNTSQFIGAAHHQRILPTYHACFTLGMHACHPHRLPIRLLLLELPHWQSRRCGFPYHGTNVKPAKYGCTWLAITTCLLFAYKLPLCHKCILAEGQPWNLMVLKTCPR